MSRFRHLGRTSRGIFATLLVAASSSGCGTLHYLLQAAEGQIALLNRARPIPEVLKDERTPPRIRKLLAEIEPIKKFGELHGLKPTSNYREYVQLDRSAAVYVVSACEPLKFESKEWHFPVVGAFPYLGWFDLEQARKFAAELKKEPEHWDVDLRGAGAYSTLGWFRDAVLSTMISSGDEALGDLVNVVLHESTHATLYLSGQAYFNESLAMFVADHLTRAYLSGPALTAYDEGQKRDAHYVARMHQAYEDLHKIYDSGKGDNEKLSEKKTILEALSVDLKAKREINNATIVQFREYNVGTDDFDAVLKTCGGDMPRFVRYLKAKLGSSSFSKSQQEDLGPVLQPLAKAECPA